jgi:hypothetical protein
LRAAPGMKPDGGAVDQALNALSASCADCHRKHRN